MMTLVSASEDLQQRTLSSLPGLWQKIRYVAGLRAGDGRYRHWGLDRTFGEPASQAALSAAHSELFLQLLRTPLRQLAGDYIQAEATEGGPTDWSLYIPADPRGGSAAHFNSIVSALQALASTPRP
jgi:hypothetical protein